MASYLTEATVPRETADLARYYQRGMDSLPEEERIYRQFGQMIADGTMTYAEVLDLCMPHAIREATVAELDDLEGLEERVGKRLADAADAAARGTPDPTAAEPRQDMHPRLAEALGIDRHRSVSVEELANLLAGQRTDGADIPGAHRRQISFVDCCFSADKSVSLAWAFAPTEAERNQIAQAHRDAVDAAMAYVASEIGIARRGTKGADWQSGHIGWVKFDHYASRPTLEVARGDHTELVSLKVTGDPNLHTHVAVLNVVLCEDGHMGSLFLQRLEGRVHEFGAYYQAHLAQNLRRIGADGALDEETGAFRLTAILDYVREAFSKRGRDAERTARQWAADAGRDWDTMPGGEKVELLKRASAARRQTKMEADAVSDFAEWKRQAEAMGWRHEGVLPKGTPEPLVVLPPEQRHALAYEASLPIVEKALSKSAVVDMATVRTAATRGLIVSGVESPADIRAVVRRMAERGVRQDGEMTALIAGRDGPKARVTTEKHVGREEDLVALARAAGQDRSAALPAARLLAAAKEVGIRFKGEHGRAQREAMLRLGTGGRLGVVIGVAGSGKSAMVGALARAWHADGRTVYGAALAWRQTDDLAAAGIPQGRLHALSVFLSRAEAGKIELDRKSVLVIDELGLVGTVDAMRVLRLQARTGMHVVALGDELQCQSPTAGGVIDLFRRALGPEQVPELLTTVRQQTERERETSLLFRQGRAAEALDRKDRDGTLEIVPGGYGDAVERVADLWLSRVRANADDPHYRLTVSAPTNEDARAIGAAIRERRRQGGEVGPDVAVVKAADQNGATYDLPLARGDRVRLFASTVASFEGARHGTIGRNGSVLEVVSVEPGGLRLRNARGREGLVAWSPLADKETGRTRLAYGDCLTVHAAQGLTSTEHIDAMPAGTKGVNAFSAYVAESRHRRASWLVTSDGAERLEIIGRRPLGDQRAIERDDVRTNMARNLSRQPEKSSALLFLERATDLRRQVARGLQSGLRPLEEREAAGQPRTTLRQTFERRRARESIRAVTQRVREIGAQVRPVVGAVAEKVRERGQRARM